MVLERLFARQKSQTGSWSGTDGKVGRKVGGSKIMMVYQPVENDGKTLAGTKTTSM